MVELHLIAVGLTGVSSAEDAGENQGVHDGRQCNDLQASHSHNVRLRRRRLPISLLCCHDGKGSAYRLRSALGTIADGVDEFGAIIRDKDANGEGATFDYTST